MYVYGEGEFGGLGTLSGDLIVWGNQLALGRLMVWEM